MTLLGSGTPMSFLYVADRDRALRFYEQLGLALRGSDDFGDFIETSGGLIRMTVMADHTAGPHPVLGWEVSDILATARDLNERGVRLMVYEGMGQDALGVWTSPDGKAKVAWFTDHDGNVLSLSEAVR